MSPIAEIAQFFEHGIVEARTLARNLLIFGDEIPESQETTFAVLEYLRATLTQISGVALTICVDCREVVEKLIAVEDLEIFPTLAA